MTFLEGMAKAHVNDRQIAAHAVVGHLAAPLSLSGTAIYQWSFLNNNSSELDRLIARHIGSHFTLSDTMQCK